jgi:hypothetical protein
MAWAVGQWAVARVRRLLAGDAAVPAELPGHEILGAPRPSSGSGEGKPGPFRAALGIGVLAGFGMAIWLKGFGFYERSGLRLDLELVALFGAAVAVVKLRRDRPAVGEPPAEPNDEMAKKGWALATAAGAAAIAAVDFFIRHR